MSNTGIDALLNFIRDIRIEETGTDLQQHVRMCFLDLAMTICCGAHNESSRLGAEYAHAFLSGNEATVFRTGEKTSLAGAALANAVAANALDIDDGYSMTKGHPGAGIISGILAAAEFAGSTFGDVLSALLAGYETAMRQGLALQDYYGFYHSTGSYAGVGTAAAAGKLMRLNLTQLSNALGIADYYGPLTPCMRTVRTPSLNKDGIYLGSKLGMEAVLLAQTGFDGKAHILSDEKYGEYISSLGSRYYIFDLYFKFFSCCRWAQGALTALKQLKESIQIVPADIGRIDVFSYGASGELYAGVPANETEAQYNLLYPVAVYLLCGDFGPVQSSIRIDTSEAVTELMRKITFRSDPEYEKLFPAKRYTRVEITLKSGEIIKSGAVEPLGEPGSGISMEDIIEKGIRINSLYHTPERVRKAIDTILSCRYGDSFAPVLAEIKALAATEQDI